MEKDKEARAGERRTNGNLYNYSLKVKIKLFIITQTSQQQGGTIKL